MKIYLVQHGLSAKQGEDGQSVLTTQGQEETKRIAIVAAGYGIDVAHIVHSGKKRAEQTARIFQETLGHATLPSSITGIKPLDAVDEFAAGIKEYNRHLIVGHLPFLERLVSFLVAGDESLQVYRFQNSGIVCLEAEQTERAGDNWYIKWTLNPVIS